MNILIIDNYDSFTYNIVNFIPTQHSCKILRNDDKLILDADDFDKIIISPGPGIPKETGLVNFFLKKYYKKKSILGVCLGMQCICEFFGGKLKNLENVLHGVKSKLFINDSNCKLFNNIPDNILIGHYHSWVIDKMPDDFRITSYNDKKIITSIEHDTYDLQGVQFHPESILTEHGKDIFINWLN